MPTPKHPDAQHGWHAAAGAVRVDPALADGRERLWTMSLEERIEAMRRGELTLDQLAAWSRARPAEVPLVNGEFEWIAMTTPEVADETNRTGRARG